MSRLRQRGFLGSGIDDAIRGLVIVGAIAGAVFAAVIGWGVPALWAWIKPWLHALTASGG